MSGKRVNHFVALTLGAFAKLVLMEGYHERRPQKDIYAALEREGVHIVKPTAEDVELAAKATRANLQQFPESLRGYAGTLAEACASYVSGFVIQDTFGGDHDARRAWRDEMALAYGQEFRNLYEKNKLRINAIQSISGYLDLIGSMIDRSHADPALADALRELQSKLPPLEGYNELSDEEKLARVRDVEAVARGYLRLVENR